MAPSDETPTTGPERSVEQIEPAVQIEPEGQINGPSAMRANLSMTGRDPYHLVEGHARRRDCVAWHCQPATDS